jgi:2-succinyl-5-enolpyruvyl-6-hydroxy-3-cyclohexene-1-carboxylate synthase
MSNIETATQILKILAQAQVKNIIICAGARNAPFVYLLEKVSGVKVWNFFEERSAAFFALGLAQSSQSPVVVITTSGTAVAELLPAAIEAALTKTPLIFLTADRPSSLKIELLKKKLEENLKFMAGFWESPSSDILTSV